MLKDEIENAQRLVKTDAYQLSIGEVVNMYKDKNSLSTRIFSGFSGGRLAKSLS